MDRIVSVIIPTKVERKKDFKKAFKSVTNQTYKHIEIIPVYEGKNSAEAKNIGIRKSKGDYIAFLDDDDEWLSTKIEKQLTLFDEYNTVLVGCWIDDRRFKKPYILKCEDEVYLKELLKKFNFLATSAYMFDAKWLKQNMFDTSFPSAQDYELAIRACMIYPIKCYPEVLVVQHKSKNQITKDWRKKKQGLKLLCRKYRELYKKYGFLTYVNFRIKFFGLQCLYSLAYVFGERIYKIIIPLKKR